MRPKTQDQIETERRKRLAEDQQVIYKGRKIREIVMSDGWNKFVLPFMKSEEERLVKESRFNPLEGDQPSVERLAFLNSFNSGAIFMLNSLQENLYHWMNAAEEAELKLKRQAGRKDEKNI